jgi:hypothetical protein
MTQSYTFLEAAEAYKTIDLNIPTPDVLLESRMRSARVEPWVKSLRPDEFPWGFLGLARSNPACKTAHSMFLCVLGYPENRVHVQPGLNTVTKRGLMG